MHIWDSAEPTGYITVTNSQERASVGEAGYRSQYLSHAKRALYHLSYIPTITHTHTHNTHIPTHKHHNTTHATTHTTRTNTHTNDLPINLAHRTNRHVERCGEQALKQAGPTQLLLPLPHKWHKPTRSSTCFSLLALPFSFFLSPSLPPPRPTTLLLLAYSRRHAKPSAPGVVLDVSPLPI